MFVKAADISLEVKKARKIEETNKPYKHKRKWKKWFDMECRTQKDITRRLGILKHQNPSDLSLKRLHNEELMNYKKLCNRKKTNFEQQQIEKLEELTLDSSEFWNEGKHFKRLS